MWSVCNNHYSTPELVFMEFCRPTDLPKVRPRRGRVFIVFVAVSGRTGNDIEILFRGRTFGRSVGLQKSMKTNKKAEAQMNVGILSRSVVLYGHVAGRVVAWPRCRFSRGCFDAISVSFATAGLQDARAQTAATRQVRSAVAQVIEP
jgi:hypothetical protein